MSEIDDAIRYFLEDVEDCENAIRGIKNTLKISEYEKEEIDALRTHADESRMLVEWLKELKQLREQTRWIPVSERLPEVGSEVLVCFDFKSKRSVYISDFYGDGEFHGLDDEYLTPEGRKYRKAVAWMPLPEPYKAEGSDKE